MKTRRDVMAAFDRGQIPTIACINKATVDLGVKFDRLIAVLQKFVDRHFAPIWGTHARLVESDRFINDAWAMAFLDDADAANLEGYHAVTRHRLPLSKVFVKTTLADESKVSVTACHELAEMLVDPAVNLWAEGRQSRLYAYEMSDAVEEVEFEIDGVAMSDFVYPAYFEIFRRSKSTQFDHCRKVTRPLELLRGGYALVRHGGTVKQIFGSAAKKKRFGREDRRGHRSQYRHLGVSPSRLSTAR